MSRYIKKIIELTKMNTKKITKIVKINEHDEIVEISNKNYVRFYNSKKN